MADLFAGAELGGTKCILLLARGPDDILAREQVPTTSVDETLGALENILSGWRAQHNIAALGIGSFGPLDLDPHSDTYGQITTTPKPGWTGAPVLERLQLAAGVRAVIDTDVNGAAFAEMRWGSGRGMDDFAYITVGTGVGVGAIVGDRSTYGQGHGEMGHLRVPRLPGDDWPGICGFHGDCVEGLACGPAIAKRHGPGPVAGDWAGWDSVEHALAMLIHNLLLSLQPQRILVGGGVVGGRPQLINGIRQRALQSLGNFYTAAGLADDFLVAPGLGDRAGPLGALAIGLSAVGH